MKKKLKFKAEEEKVFKLLDKTTQLFDSIQNEKVAFIVKDFQDKVKQLKKKIKLEIAFVGQYSAGKSTIISAISREKDIKIGQDITTDVPKAYPWGNVLLIDTPGIYAGRPEHDKASIDYMNRADLLVYVITSQGFTSETASNFKKIAFKENRIDKMMLIINKSSQGDKELSQESWISDALKVTEPKTADDLFLTIIDAKDYIEAFEIEDEEDRKELIEYSGFEQFIENLNDFISKKGLLGQLITPLNLNQDYLNRMINELTAGNEDTRNLLELLNRKHLRLIESKRNITDIVEGHINELVSDIKKEGNKIANLIEKDGDEEVLKHESKNSENNIKDLIDNVNKKIEYSITREFEKLQDELDVLMQSELAQTLINQGTINITFNTNIKLQGFNKNKISSGVDILKNIGSFAEKFAINEKALETGVKGLKVVSNSDAHKTVYKIGKFFGHKFKPYEAIKYADKVGKLGSFIGKIAPILPFLSAGYEEYRENKYAREIMEAKQKVRQDYNSIANDVKKSFNEQFFKFISESYDIEINDNETMRKAIRKSEKLENKEVLKLENLLDKNIKILEELGAE